MTIKRDKKILYHFICVLLLGGLFLFCSIILLNDSKSDLTFEKDYPFNPREGKVFYSMKTLDNEESTWSITYPYKDLEKLRLRLYYLDERLAPPTEF